jgi:hypothetical protein
VLAEGSAPSNRYPGLMGIVKVRDSEFRALADEYLAGRGLVLESPCAIRFNHPLWDLRDVLGWVLDRKPARFGRINSGEDWKSAMGRAVLYRYA